MTQPPTRSLEEEMAELLPALSERLDAELFALTEEELAAQWYFRWVRAEGATWNLYRFTAALETFSRRCRRWEEHHHGSMCVVERVRDKYLLPKIRRFLTDFRQHERRLS